MADRSLRGRVAVVGVGETEYFRHGQATDPEFVLCLKAILAACADAGLDPTDIDGFASYSNDRNDPPTLATALEYDRRAIVEPAVNCRELECGVLGNDDPIASVMGEIVPSGEFYDCDSHVLALGYIGMTLGSYRWLRPQGRRTAQEIAEEFSTALLRGLIRDETTRVESPLALSACLPTLRPIARSSGTLSACLRSPLSTLSTSRSCRATPYSNSAMSRNAHSGLPRL